MAETAMATEAAAGGMGSILISFISLLIIAALFYFLIIKRR